MLDDLTTDLDGLDYPILFGKSYINVISIGRRVWISQISVMNLVITHSTWP